MAWSEDGTPDRLNLGRAALGEPFCQQAAGLGGPCSVACPANAARISTDHPEIFANAQTKRGPGRPQQQCRIDAGASRTPGSQVARVHLVPSQTKARPKPGLKLAYLSMRIHILPQGGAQGMRGLMVFTTAVVERSCPRHAEWARPLLPKPASSSTGG